MPADEPQSIWSRPEPGERGAAYNRAGIAAAGIAIADAEGAKALSMRRVAAELGAGTMTLYHYVKNKDELMALIGDAIMGEVLIPDDEMPTDWRGALTQIAINSKNAFLNHPWVFDVQLGSDGGPNGTKHFEQSLAAVSLTGLDRLSSLELVSMVDDYVFGFALRHNSMSGLAEGDPEKLADEWADLMANRLGALHDDAFPNIQALFGDRDPREVLIEMFGVALGPGRFERGLELVLDGIERRIEREGRSA